MLVWHFVIAFMYLEHDSHCNGYQIFLESLVIIHLDMLWKLLGAKTCQVYSIDWYLGNVWSKKEVKEQLLWEQNFCYGI
ncbi:F-box/kelch-repeat protein [Pyrus ussuriensis x Pyrus communis]|uniref:F-box/kelch-repeat protein n=1 Tax=Pyrus ussuriensis x Pyrus communis TaxID=2448454 RepID=A0A5N5HDD8_9ROSA|nr:F-box/kelch-repeat protein [Pyrus ussuriensis x Pyrus communis]